MENSREKSTTRPPPTHKNNAHSCDQHSSNSAHQTPAILLDISNVVSNTYQGAKWYRIQREARDRDTPMEGTVGQKRNITDGSDHLVLPRKKQVVSLDDKENTQILAEASYQPCQKQ